MITPNKCKVRRMIALGQPVQQAATWSPEEEQELVRRIDKRLMPLLVITYGLQYYDKVMLSQAACVVRAQARYTTNHTTGRLYSDCAKISA
jgi:hypothetical protein